MRAESPAKNVGVANVPHDKRETDRHSVEPVVLSGERENLWERCQCQPKPEHANDASRVEEAIGEEAPGFVVERAPEGVGSGEQTRIRDQETGDDLNGDAPTG